MRDRRPEKGKEFVLMLGAGASMTSGVKSTPQIKAEVLEQYGRDITGATPDERFDNLWEQSNPDQRRRYLERHLEGKPSPGYGYLARLIEDGWFRIAMTFNFDVLLEQALESIGFTDMRRIVHGETIEDEMAGMVSMDRPAFKLIKLHGSLLSSNRFFFDIREMLAYPKPIADLVSKLTHRDIVMCGYGFKDVCVMKAFSEQGGQIVCVNPSLPEFLRGYLKDRKSTDKAIDLGFDDFFTQLHDELRAKPKPQKASRPNPFKFLQSCDEDDRETLLRRNGEIDRFHQALGKQVPPRVIAVAGPNKSGKTSLVRAGLLPSLDRERFEGFYVRCQADLAESIATALWPDDEKAATLSIPEVYARLETSKGKTQFVLFLDQFDRAAETFKIKTREGKTAFVAFLKTTLLAAPPNVTLVVVIELALGQQVSEACEDAGVMLTSIACDAMDTEDVREIIRTLAKRVEAPIPDSIVMHLAKQYEEHNEAQGPERFTLAHVQAVCHVLVAREVFDFDTYEQEFKKYGAALHRAINFCDFITFVEDFDWEDAHWFRNMVKVPLNKNKEEIADFIRQHYSEMVLKTDMKPRKPAPGGAAGGGE